MALAAIPGGTFRVTITKSITRANAQKTLERLFMSDSSVAAPVEARQANFVDKPKRRGGRIWTKYANKVHLDLVKGNSAVIKATPQAVRDLSSVEEFVEVASA